MKRKIGISMIVCLFLGIFLFSSLTGSVATTTIAFAVSAALIGFVWFAVCLIMG